MVSTGLPGASTVILATAGASASGFDEPHPKNKTTARRQSNVRNFMIDGLQRGQCRLSSSNQPKASLSQWRAEIARSRLRDAISGLRCNRELAAPARPMFDVDDDDAEAAGCKKRHRNH